MKNSVTVVLVVACFALGCSWQGRGQSAKPGQQRQAPEPGEVYQTLREQFLKFKPEGLGVSPGSDSEPYGVLMEMGFTDGIVSYVSTARGEASLYTGVGGGIIGGGGHEGVKRAARAFVSESGSHLPRMAKAGEFPYAGAGRVRFYVLTRGGVYTVEAGEGELRGERHALHALYRAGHEVITQLLLTTEKKANDNQ